jgi:RNA polymerase sigma-70 factor (ECF subfamily)
MSSSDPRDEHLIARYLRGDAAAFDALYRRYDLKTFAFVRQMLHPTDRATVEDLHQDGWLAVATKAASFAPAKAKFSTWLYTVLRNRVVDHLRASRQQLHDAEFDVDTTVSPAPGPERLLAHKHIVRDVERCLMTLPLEQRETFLLFAVVELSLAEIGEVTGAPVETAKTRLRYAREVLRSRLGEGQHG